MFIETVVKEEQKVFGSFFPKRNKQHFITLYQFTFLVFKRKILDPIKPSARDTQTRNNMRW